MTANPNPRSILALAEHLRVSPEELVIVCRFCSWPLTWEDLMSFEWKCLQLLWRNGQAFGCCRGCCRMLAFQEHKQFCQREIRGPDLLNLLRLPLHLIFIRCVRCYKVLSYAEKLHIYTSNAVYCCVRGCWRGLCLVCTPR